MVDPLLLPGYRVERRAGSGGSGDVWVAVEVRTGRRVALKRLRDTGRGQREAMQREATVQAGLRHPHVLSVEAVLESATGLVLVLEHAAGGSLGEVLERRGPLSPGEVVTVLGPVAQALAAAHRSGVVHGDVTPANVLLTAEGRPLLADLGAARVAGLGGPGSGEVAATAGYAAPEVLAGSPPRPAADVHSLACVVVRALTGAPPALVPGAPPGAPERLGLLPAGTREVLDRALARRPRDRPDADEVVAALFAAAVPEPVDLALDRRATPPARRAGAPGEGRALAADGAVDDVDDVDDVDPAVHDAVTAAVVASPPARRSPAPASQGPGSDAPRWCSRRVSVGSTVVASVVAALAVVGLAPPLVSAWRAVRAEQVAGQVAGQVAPSPAQVAPTPSASAPTTTPSAAAPAPPAAIVPAPTPSPATPASRASPPRTPSAAAVECPPAQPGSAGGAPGVDWVAVLTGLHTARAAAFATGDAGRLCGAYAAGSPGLRADRATLADHARSGLRTRGLRVDVLVAEPRRATAGSAVVEVVDRLSAYELVDHRGAVAGREPALAAERWRAALVRTPAGWRFR